MTTLARIASARDVAAALVAVDPVYLPIFERLDEEYRRAEAAARIAKPSLVVIGARRQIATGLRRVCN